MGWLVSDFFPKFLNKVFVSSIIGVIFLVAWIFVSLIYYPENLVPGWSSLILTLMVILVLQTFSFIFITFYIKKYLIKHLVKKLFRNEIISRMKKLIWYIFWILILLFFTKIDYRLTRRFIVAQTILITFPWKL